MVVSPAAIAGLRAPSAMVKVGPPLFARGPRRGSPEMFPAPGEVLELSFKVPSSTRLLRLVPMVPPPAKSPPLVLLAMMVLAMLRVLPPSA